MQTPAGKRPISRCFDLGVDGIGVAVICWALASFLLSGSLDRTWVLAALGGVPLIALMSRFPLVLTRGTGGIEVGFESAVLVFLGCLHGGSGALAVWSAGQAVSQLTTPKRPDVRVFNVALSTISGALALTTMRGIGGLGTSSPRELLAVGVGCAIYFVTDYVVSGVSVALENGSPVRAELTSNHALMAGGLFVAIDSLGYLGALVTRSLPAWSALLLGVPIITILVATRAMSRGAEHQRRLSALFDAAAALQGAGSRAHVLDVLRGQVRAVVALANVAQEALSRLRLGEQITRQAREDPITGLPNRSEFVDQVERAVRAGQDGGSPVAVLYLDLDGFKSVNDRFG